MPTYEYTCDACTHGFEAQQRITEDPLTRCPKCEKLALKRLVGTGNFILKGAGWYADAYSGSGGAKAEAAPPSGGMCGGCGNEPGSCSN